MTKILIVEDNQTNRKLARLILEQAGYEVIEAEDGVAGVAAAGSEQPTLILMDVQMPGLDGLSATRMLKANLDTAHIKIIILTAFAMRGDEERVREAGSDGYIAKPFTHQKFLDTVKAVLAGHRKL